MLIKFLGLEVEGTRDTLYFSVGGPEFFAMFLDWSGMKNGVVDWRGRNVWRQDAY
jgi:hypothetical protein